MMTAQKIKDKKQRLIIFIMITFVSIGMISCNKEIKGNPDRFKQGVFEIPETDSYGKTIITRVDSLQIEKFYKKVNISNEKGVSVKEIQRIDTLYIKWVNNFAYTLLMKNPKSKLDKDPIFVQINKVTNNSYNFKARVGYSKFTQEGTVYKIK